MASWRLQSSTTVLTGYKLGEGYHGQRRELPGLRFNERELYSQAIAQQLSSELDSDGVINGHLQPLLERNHQMLGPDEVDAKSLFKCVRIINAARRPVAGRDVSPQRLVDHKNTWYQDGWCRRTECLRRFSLDAIEQADLLDIKAKDVGAKALQAAMDAGKASSRVPSGTGPRSASTPTRRSGSARRSGTPSRWATGPTRNATN